MHIEPLDPRHDLAQFECGAKELDDCLRIHAIEYKRRNLSRTVVLIDDADEVVGCYSLTMGGVRKSELPARYGRGLPGFEIAMVLLARMAIASRRQGERDSLETCSSTRSSTPRAAGQHAAARFIAVDPIDGGVRGRGGSRPGTAVAAAA